MTVEGPALAVLLHRLIDTPADCLPFPTTHAARVADDSTMQIRTVAMVHDTLVTLGIINTFDLGAFESRSASWSNDYRCIAMMSAWLLSDPSFGGLLSSERALIAFTEDVEMFVNAFPAPTWHDDPDHREEFCRLILRRFDLRPAGESEAQAEDRLGGISSLDRRQVMLETRQAEMRAAAVLRALQEEEARRSADKATRE